MISKILNKPYLFWSVLGGLVFIPFLGVSHLFDWDEINFAESAREMLVSGDFLSVQINFQPFWEKPPLFMWLQVLSFQFFGTFTESAWTSMEFAARFPNALVGIATLLIVYKIGEKHVSKRMGHLWAFSYLAAITPHIYASSGIIDPLFNLFIFLGVYSISQFYTHTGSLNKAYQAGIFIGLGMLTKGPVALLLWGLTTCIFVVLNRKTVFAQIKQYVFGTVLAVLIALFIFAAWYALIVWKFGWGILFDFFAYQVRLLRTGDAGHGQPFYYHFFVLLFGCFPIAIWAGPRLFARKKASTQLSQWMQILFWVVLILFSLVKTKIVHYSSMCWLPLTYFSALVLHEWMEEKWVWNRKYSIFMAFVGLVLAVVLSLVPWIGMHAGDFSVYIKDVFVQGNLQAPVYWAGWEPGIGIFLGLVVIWTLSRRTVLIKHIWQLMVACVLVIMVYMAVVVPKIEGYTQATPLDFYESHVGQKVYIEPVGFKSFAHLLYFQKPAYSPGGEELMKQSSVNRPTYLVMKTNAEDRFKYHPNLILIKEENGFLFYKHK
jgi:4-amino-4-deoxy-L-arabinose transferase-like glycosyltransferase